MKKEISLGHIDDELETNDGDSTGFNILAFAILEEDIEMIKFLLENGANPNRILYDRFTSIQILARESNNPEIINLVNVKTDVCEIFCLFQN